MCELVYLSPVAMGCDMQFKQNKATISEIKCLDGK